jgi:riboflavin synthase
MFTGIITDIGAVKEISKPHDTRFVIETAYDLDKITLGASIACNGVCLTVVEKDVNVFVVDASDETLSCTTLNNWQVGTRINLEQALKMGDELGGHMVSGHVDGVGSIATIEPREGSHCITFTLSEALAPFVAKKGSVTVDGVSLTVNAVFPDSFTVNIIPHTWDHTVFALKKTGDSVNIEIDVIARYIARAIEFKT